MKDEDPKYSGHEMAVINHHSVEFDGSSDEDEELHENVNHSKITKKDNPAVEIDYDDDDEDIRNILQAPLISAGLPPERMQLKKMFGILSFELCLGFIQNSLAMILLPTEMKQFFPNNAALAVGLLAATSALLSVSSPAIAVISDKSRWQWGRRRPIILGATIWMLLGLVLMFYFSSSSTYALDYSLSHRAAIWITGYYFLQLGIVFSTTAFSSLIPDLIPASQHGIASTIFALYAVIGSAIGYIFVGFVLPLASSPLPYLFMLLLVGSCCCTTLYFAEEQPYIPEYTPSQQRKKKAQLLLDFLRSLVIGLQDRDFFMVWIARILYNMGLSPQAFLLFLVTDLTDSTHPTRDVTILALSAQIVGLLAALPASKLSAKYGRKKLVYLTTCVMSLVYLSLLSARPIWSYWIAGAFFGLGQGVYATVDLALAIDCLPESSSSNRDMGLWGIANSVGQMLGLYLAGPLLQNIGNTHDTLHPSRYSRYGYVTIFSCGAIYMIVAAVLIFFLRKSR